MTNAIETTDLTRTFNRLVAVDGLNLSVNAGTIFGFLGPNGAGKTTTISMLTGQLRPTRGRAVVAGVDVQRQGELGGQIGVCFEEQNLYDRLSARDNLRFFARLYGTEERRVDQLLSLVGLAERARDRVKKFSTGMRQRLCIARALVHRPRVLFLDEPTRGLDPASARDIRHLVAALPEEGVTVFLTTHYMEEADQLCHVVAFLDQGRIVARGTPSELKLQHGRRAVRVHLRPRPGECEPDALLLSLDDPAQRERLGRIVAGGEALTVHSCEATLEEVFLKLTGRSLQ